jgi:hypothetical protein
LQSAGEPTAAGRVPPVVVLGDACAELLAVAINAAGMHTATNQALVVFMVP